MLKIKHLASAELFATTKFSADSSNTTYFIGNNTTQIAGTPDVLYEDLVFCKGSDLIYTHGHFYGNQPDGNFVKQIANLATYNGVENEIVQYVGEDTNDYKRGFFYKMTSTPNTIMQPTWQQIDIQPEFDVDSIPLATTSAKGLMSANDKKLLNRFNVYFSYLSIGTPGLTENFCKKFMQYIRTTFGDGLVIGRLNPDVTGLVIGYDYADGKYAGYQFFATNGYLRYFGYTNGTFFMKDISNS